MTAVDGELSALVKRHRLAGATVGPLAELIRVLAEDDTAPTTVRAPEAAVNTHIADSLSALELDAVRSATTIADLGAGAGFPGLVLAAAVPAARVALVESVARKCAFIAAAAEAASLENVEVVNARAEEWPAGLGANDVVTARALGPLAILAEYAAPLLRLGGTLVAWKGVPDAEEERAAAVAADELGLELVERRAVEPFPGADRHRLYVYSKVRDTPGRYPRRAGMARKRPLGTSR
jgi:16S rRNA (guanine527-N7)-methyltransferase